MGHERIIIPAKEQAETLDFQLVAAYCIDKLSAEVEYYAVPEVFGNKKEQASIFLNSV